MVLYPQVILMFAADISKIMGWTRNGSLWLPALRSFMFSPGGGGCGCCGVPCEYCLGDVPDEIMVKLENVTDGTTPCSTSPVCASVFNNWFILPKNDSCRYSLTDDWTCENCDTYKGYPCSSGWRTYFAIRAWWQNNYVTWGGTNVGYALVVDVTIALCWCATSDTSQLKAKYYYAYGSEKPSCLLASEITLTRDVAALTPCNFSTSVCKAKAA